MLKTPPPELTNCFCFGKFSLEKKLSLKISLLAFPWNHITPPPLSKNFSKSPTPSLDIPSIL